MKEKEVNEKVKVWLEKQNYSYKGVLKGGDVPIANGKRDVKLDAHGVRLINDKNKIVNFEEGKGYDGNSNTKDYQFESIWIEAKGDVGMSDLIEAFGRVCYAVWHSRGFGLVAVPEKQFEMMVEEKDFFAQIAKVVIGKGAAGVMNVETNIIIRL